MIKYVTGVLFSPDKKEVVNLLKQKGPANLIGKLTFPGGKQEPGESPEEALSREFLEECGVVVPPEDWKGVLVVEHESYRLQVFCATSEMLSMARTTEKEPVSVNKVKQIVNLCKNNPTAFVPEFLEYIEKSVKTLSD